MQSLLTAISRTLRTSCGLIYLRVEIDVKLVTKGALDEMTTCTGQKLSACNTYLLFFKIPAFCCAEEDVQEKLFLSN